jgi:hypothetical protein
MTPSHPTTIEDAIVAFAVSLAQLDTTIEEDKLLEYDIPQLLLLIAEKVGECNWNVIEKVFHVLSKISHTKAGSEKIIKSNGINVISKLLLCHNDNPQMVLFGSQVLAFIAQIDSTKSTISNTAIPCLVHIINKASKMDVETYSPYIAQVFVTLSVFALYSDANKILISGSSIPNASTIILEQFNDVQTLGACATMIANVSYKRPCAAHHLLSSGLVEMLVQTCAEKLSVDEHQKQLEQVLIVIANVSNSQENSSLTYSIDGIVEFIVHLLQQADKPSVIRNAAIACASMSWDCNVARRHFCHAAAIEALIDIVLRMGMYDETDEDREESKAAEAATWALLVLAMDVTASQRFEDNAHDFQALIQLYLQTDSEIVLLSGSMFVSALLPSTSTKKILASEGRQSYIENQCGGQVIQRCMNEVFFCDEALCPSWLLQSISILSTKTSDTEEYGILSVKDYFKQSELYQCIKPDSLK